MSRRTKPKKRSAKRTAAEHRNRPGQEGDNSNYGRKRKYCHAHGVWGFQVLEPKPWKGSK